MKSSDDAILHRVKGGETPLYGVLVERHQRRLHAIATSILRDREEAEEAVQEAHLHAFTHLDQFAGRSSFLTWLSAITRNAALMRVRHSHQFRLLMNSVPLDSAGVELAQDSRECDAETALLRRETVATVRQKVRRLPPPYRGVLILRDLRGLTTQETASELSISTDCIKTRLHRARRMLRKSFPSQGVC